MTSFKALTALAFLSLATTAFACNGVWVPNTAGNWSTGFTPCEPLNPGDTATFGTPPPGPVAVNLDVTPSVTVLTFQNANPYTISGTGQLNITGSSAGAPSYVNVTQGNHVINTPVNLANSTVFTTNISAGSSINFFASVVDGSTSSILVNGPGQTNVNCTPTTGSVFLVVNGSATIQNNGNLIFNNSSDTASSIFNSGLVTGLQLTVNSGSLAFNNTGSVQSTAAETSGLLLDVTTNLILNNGSINLINHGDIENVGVNQAVGVLGDISGNFTMNGGILNLLNYGTVQTNGVTSPSTGSNFAVFGQININAGTVLIDNFGALSPNSIGAAFTAVNHPININGGILINNDVVSTTVAFPAPVVIVGPQGTLAGNGIFVGGIASPTLVINNGTAIPGTPDSIPGTMTIVGNYQQSSTGTLLSNISNIDSYGQISAVDVAGIGGTATIAGTLDLYGDSGIKVKPGDAFKVVTTTKGVNGSFSSVNMLNSPYIPMVFYFPNFVEVILNAGSYPALYQSVFASINHKNIRLEREMQNIHQRFRKEEAPREVVRNHMFSSRQGHTLAAMPINLGSPPISQDVSMHEEREQERFHREIEFCNNTPWNVYVGPIGSVGVVHHKGFNAGFGEWSAGALAGCDYAFEEIGVGFLAEYERIHGNVHRNWGKFNIDQVNASFYSTYVPQSVPELAVNGIIGGGYEGSHIHRHTGMTGKSVAQGNSNGWELDALFGLEYAVTSKHVQQFSDNFRFTPMVNLQYIYVHFPQYKEHGAGAFDLSVSTLKAQSLRSTLGAWFNYLWQWKDLDINLQADVGWQREYFDRGSSINFAGVSTSTLKTRGAGRNTCLAGLDLLFTLYKSYGIEASYDFEWNKMFHDHSFYLGFSFEF